MENNSDTGWCEFCPSTCTHTHRFNGHFSRWTRVSQCQLRVDVSSSFILCAFSWDRLELFIFSLTYFPSTVPPWLRSSELIRQFLSFVRHRVLFSSGVIYICPLLLSCPAFSFDPVSDLSAQSEPSTHGTTAYDRRASMRAMPCNQSYGHLGCRIGTNGRIVLMHALSALQPFHFNYFNIMSHY